YGRGVGEVAVDWKLALRRRPKDGIDLALDDAARIHLHKNFRFVAGFDIAQFVLPVECQQPRIVLLDEAHHGHGRELGRAYAGLQGKIGHAPVRWSNVDAALEVEFLLAQIGFGLENLRPSLRFRGVAGAEMFRRRKRAIIATMGSVMTMNWLVKFQGSHLNLKKMSQTKKP